MSGQLRERIDNAAGSEASGLTVFSDVRKRDGFELLVQCGEVDGLDETIEVDVQQVAPVQLASATLEGEDGAFVWHSASTLQCRSARSDARWCWQSPGHGGGHCVIVQAIWVAAVCRLCRRECPA